MKALKTISIGILASTFGFSALTASASEQNDIQFSLSMNEASPEAQAFVPTHEVALTREHPRPVVFSNPFLQLDWEADISIEMDDSELIRKTRIRI